MAYGRFKWLAVYEDGTTVEVFSDNDGALDLSQLRFYGLVSLVRTGW